MRKLSVVTLVTSLSLLLLAVGCQSTDQKQKTIPTVGFVDAFEDNTIAQAKKGFFDALEKNGFSEKNKTLNVIYRNAQGNIPGLTQIIKYFIAQKVDLIASCPSLSTIAAIQNTKDIPVFMMVAPTPELMKVTDASGKGPANLYGTGETLDYIDTSFSLMPKLVAPHAGKLRIGMLYNQSEPQSVEALERIRKLAEGLGVELVATPVNTSADVQLVAKSLLNKKIDAFFANPDNTIFSSFETIVKACSDAGVPIFTSEAGLVDRGAVAAYGADIYQWGYQTGVQAAQYLLHGNEGLQWQMVTLRKKVYNPEAAKRFNITIPEGYEALK